MQKYKVIYNPTSGRKIEQDKIFKICKKLVEEQNIEVTIYATKKKGDAQEAAIRACEQGIDTIIGCGGDGTINEIVNGLMQLEHRPKLAILPAGTVNDFAKFLKLPTNPVSFVNMIKKADTQKVDIGVLGNEYFINVAAAGAFSNIPHEVPSDTKTVLGKYAYYFKGALELGDHLEKCYPINVELDDETFDANALLFLVANTSSVGGFPKMAPQALLNDGVLDLLIIEKAPPAELISIFGKILRGDHITHPKVIYKKSKKIEITSKNKMTIDVDGELSNSDKMKFGIKNKALDIYIFN